MSASKEYKFRDPTPKIDEIKTQLCYSVKRACARQGWNQIQAAAFLETSRSRIHEVDRVKIDRLTISQLFNYLAKADPNFDFIIFLKSDVGNRSED